MKKKTVDDMRRAVSYVNNGNVCVNLKDVSDEDFLACDFLRDLQMGNIREVNVVIELSRVHGLDLPLEIYANVRDNTVGALMDSINEFIERGHC